MQVSPVGFGCWPIAGVSSLEVSDKHSLATIHAAIDSGVNFLDTAYSYGYNGEADRLLAKVLCDRRSEVILASKVGQSFNARRERVIDGRPGTLVLHAREILQRLGVDHVDLMYLHIPDPNVPLADSAGAIAEIIQLGLARYAGVSNVDASQLAEFHEICPVTVVQPPFNMLQQSSVREILPFCGQHEIAIACYWVLMKGLLAGKLPRDHHFDPRDKRLTYPIYQGEAWHRSQDLLDKLRELAQHLTCTVAQLVIAWTIRRPGVSVALCGAKRSDQIVETAAAMCLQLDDPVVDQIDAWITQMTGAND